MQSHATMAVRIFVTIFVLGANSVLAAWFYTNDSLHRYDPATGAADFRYDTSSSWMTDENPSSNPAYMEYWASSGSSSSFSSDAAFFTFLRGMHVMMGATNLQLNHTGVLLLGMATIQSVLSPGTLSPGGPLSPGSPASPGPFYQDSELPEWDWRFSGSIGYADTDFAIDDSTGTEFDARERAMEIRADGRNGRFVLLSSLRHERRDGKELFADMDSESTTLRLMPGYDLLQQDVDGIQLTAFGLLDMAYIDVDEVESQERVTPGFGLAAGRAMEFGIVSAAYTFGHSRSISGDDDVTGNHYTNMHSAACRYTVPITEDVFANAGLEYAHASQTPSNLDHSFTNARFGIDMMNSGPWTLSLVYYEAIDGRDTRGGELSAGFRW